MRTTGAPPSRNVASLVALVAVVVGVVTLYWFGVSGESRESGRAFNVAGTMSEELMAETEQVKDSSTSSEAPPSRPDVAPPGAEGPWFSSLMGDMGLEPTERPTPGTTTFTGNGAGERSTRGAPTHAGGPARIVSGRGLSPGGGYAVGDGGALSAGGGGVPGAAGGGSRGRGGSSPGIGGGGSGGGPGAVAGGPGTAGQGGGPAPGNPGGGPAPAGGPVPGGPGGVPAGGGQGPRVPDGGPGRPGDGGSGGRIMVAGEFSPGASPGALVGEDITLQPDAWLVLEIYGRQPGEYDQVIASGELHLDGTLEIVLRDGFAPTAGDVFDFFDWGTLAGEFAQIILPDLGDALEWDTLNLYATGEIGVVGHVTLLAPERVPAPATLILLGIGVAVTALRWRRGL